MNRKRLTVFILLTAFLLLPAGLLSAQHTPGTDWKQRETGYFLIIYPSSLSDDAAALAVVMDEIAERNAEQIPVLHRKDKWPVVLTDRGVTANGFVSLAPRRSVWYSTPAEDFTAISDWWLLMATHEGRHMAQFDAADQGFTRFLHGLFGEYGWGAGLILGTPDWLLEGDAVVQETELSYEGRGRDPLFTREMDALILQQPETDYLRAANSSYKRSIPNHYYLGYSLSSWIRDEYGLDALEEIYRKAGRIGLPVIAINTATKNATGKLPRELYEEMADTIIEQLAPATAINDWTPSEPVSFSVETAPNVNSSEGRDPDPRDYSEWDSIFDAGADGIYGRKTALGQPPFLYRILPDGSQEKLLRLPEYADLSISRRGENIRIAWQFTRNHPVYLGKSVSDLSIMDLSPDGKVLRRRQLLTGTRYLYPSLSPDGTRLAVVLMEMGSKCRLDILDTEDGSVLSSLNLGTDSAAWSGWSPDSSKLVFTIRNDGGRRIAEWTPGNREPAYLTEQGMETVKRPFYTPDGQGIFYTSNKGGSEDLWHLDLTDQENPGRITPDKVAFRPFGIEEPVNSSSGTGILLLEYDSRRGKQITRIDCSDLDLHGEKSVEPGPASEAQSESPTALMWPDRDPMIRESVIRRGNSAYPEEDYSVVANSFNIHSWGLLPAGSLLTTTGAKLYIESADVLGSSILELGGTWDFIESSPGAYASYSFSGMRPVLGLDFRYYYRDPNTDPYHQISIYGSAYWPGNLSRSGIWSHYITPGIQGGYNWHLPAASAGEDSGYGLPVIGYSLSWYRLRRGSSRAIYPDAGWSVAGLYNHVPGSSGDQAAGSATIYLPGGPRNTSLRPAAALERRTIGFSPTVDTARGYDWSSPATVLKGTVDYDFPIAYPDWPVASVIFIQRFRMGIYSDFAFIGDSDALSTGSWTRQWSTGATFTMDFAAFNQFDGFSLGFRFNWLWQEKRPTFNLMIMDIAFF